MSNSQFFKGLLAGTVVAASGLLVFNAAAVVTGEVGGMPVNTSVTAQSIKEAEQECATGAEGTLGGAILDAVKAHLELTKMPEVEKLFDVTTDCFSSVGKIYDLSGAIPSLGSIISAAQDKLMEYAQQKACDAVKQVSGMATDPINQGIDAINSQYKDISGIVMTTIPVNPGKNSSLSSRSSPGASMRTISGISAIALPTPTTAGQPAAGSPTTADTPSETNRYTGLSNVFN